MSSYSWPSISTSKSESPNYDSHRHVGEGALDDSDSSDSDNAQKENKAEGGSSDEESGLRPLISPYHSTTVVSTTPSPLSHVAVQQQWSEDEQRTTEEAKIQSCSPVLSCEIPQPQLHCCVSRSVIACAGPQAIGASRIKGQYLDCNWGCLCR
jgi:hypothetical protein